MPLKLPNLDDRRWNDLVEEGRFLIPASTVDWTNYNSADPGITLVELFAFLTENLIYRVNRIGDENVLLFLRLIRGPEWSPGPDLDEDTRETIRDLHRPCRAVTIEDFEKIALADPSVARVRPIANRNLESGKPNAQLEEAPGHVSVVIVQRRPQQAGAREPTDPNLLAKVRRALEPARLLTTVIHVVAPRFVEFGIKLSLIVGRGADGGKIRRAAADALRNFFDPLTGGSDEEGWPFGRNVYVSEIYEIVARVPGVISVTRCSDVATKRDFPEIVFPGEKGRIIRNHANEIEAIQVRSDELVAAIIRDEDLTVVEEGSEG